MISFEWDEFKNRQNKKKHGIWFEEAQTVFADDYSRVFYDEEHSEKEDRFLIIGKSRFEKILIVVHCYHKESQLVRLISARKATLRERRVYEEGI